MKVSVRVMMSIPISVQQCSIATIVHVLKQIDLEHVTMLDLSTTDQKEINNNTLHLKLSLKAAEIHSLT